jgi:hypothetical protein
MKLIDNLRESLDSSGVTNPSKLYTPFTLFCVYFAIYFKAEILGRIFLASDWNVIHSALTDLSSPSVIEWFTFAGKVAAYSLGMILLYGLAQAGAVLIWGFSNRLNTWIGAKAEAGKYISRSDFDCSQKKIEELRIDNKNLFTQLASYHTWKPEDIQRLEQELQSSKDSYSATLEKQLKLEEENKKLSREKSENSGKLIYLEDQLKNLEDISSRIKASNRATYNLHDTLYNLSEKLKNTEEVANFINDKGLEDTLIEIISGHSKKIIKFGDHSPEIGYSLGLLISQNEMKIQIALNEDGETVAIINKSSNEIEKFLSSLPEETASKLAFHAF